MPIKIKNDGSFAVLINQLTICDFGQDLIPCSQPIDIDDHLIKNVKNPVNKFDAVKKAYADCIKYKTFTSNITNTVMTDHTLITFPAAKAFASAKKKYVRCGLNGWQMSGLRHQVQCLQLRGLTFTNFPEDRPL